MPGENYEAAAFDHPSQHPQRTAISNIKKGGRIASAPIAAHALSVIGSA